MLSAAPRAGAGELKNFISDLYGGGIVLETVPGFCGPNDCGDDFAGNALEGLNRLNSLTSDLGFPSLSSSVSSYTLDLALGVPVRTTESLGPLIGERAETLAAGNLNLGFSYTRVDYKRFEGDRLDSLSLTVPSEDINGDGLLGPTNNCVLDPEGKPIQGGEAACFFAIELDQLVIDVDLSIEQDVLALYGRYGITNRWQVGAVVPIIHNRVRAKANARVVPNSIVPQFSGFAHGPPLEPRSSTSEQKTGIGDVLLRTKYNFLRGSGRWPDLAAFGQIKLPSGDEDDLLGTGETDFLLMLVASRQIGRVAPHLNVGYELTTGSSDQDNLRYVGGFEARLHPRLTAAFDVVGRWRPNGNGVGDLIVDLGIGPKWEVFRSFIVQTNFLLPLNRSEGLRADFIWTVGVQYTFGDRR